MKPTSSKSEKGSVIGQLNPPARRPASQKQGWAKYRSHGWYLPDSNVYPLEHELFEGDLRPVIQEHVLPGHLPPSPILNDKDSVIALGSCFARELRHFLSNAGVDSAHFWIPSGLNNTFAILDFLSWCVTGQETGRGFRYERSVSGAITEWTPDAERQTYAAAFADAGAFVFTLGLAEVWQDRETGGVFWRGVPDDMFDADRHVFRLTTVEENTANLKQIVSLVRQLNATAPIVLTLSPVPLLATFREISCLTADCVSKSVLRVALDLVMAERFANVYYWPSFEIVKWVGAHLPWAAYGEGGKARDIDSRVVAKIIDAFIEAFYLPAAVEKLRARRHDASG